MKLECRRCGSEIQSKDVDMQAMNAHCKSCNFLFDFPPEIYEKRRVLAKAGGAEPYSFDVSLENQRFFEEIRLGSLPEGQELICPNCGEKVSSRNINSSCFVAICSHCNWMYDFSNEVY